MKYRINLASRKEMNYVDKTLYFFLNYVRYILVITQLTVLGVLFFRFSIDQNITDLKDSIAQKREIIKVFQPSFQDAAKVNTQLNAIQNIINDQTFQTQSLDYLLARFPKDVSLNKLNLKDGVYTLSGITISSEVLRNYYLLLKKENRFKQVDLSNIKRDESGYLFTLTAGKYSP